MTRIERIRRASGEATRRVWLLTGALGAAGLWLGVSTASPAVAAQTHTCSGTARSPGVLTGSYQSSVTIDGTCQVNAGPTSVHGSLSLRPGAVLIAAYAANHRTHRGGSSLTVTGDVRLQRGATLILGCLPLDFPCLDDPHPRQPTLSSVGRISGSLTARQPLGVLVHNATIGGNVQQAGGGAGLNCDIRGVFKLLKFGVYSDYEDLRVGRSLTVSGLRTCWLGIARVHVHGNLELISNRVFDPDAIEILSNRIGRDLVCQRNNRVWDSKEDTSNVYPRTPKPNSVGGRRVGQCQHASPPTQGGPPGRGPF